MGWGEERADAARLQANPRRGCGRHDAPDRGRNRGRKDLVAKAIHHFSHRRHAPFIAVNCAGITESLLGSQLFGHRKRAFTGAIADHQGVFEAANGGTIFLDEIGDVPATMQSSLLRVLEEREITRLGTRAPGRSPCA
jgi:transcriptional regulator with GAF, ATPase, and Fis domain